MLKIGQQFPHFHLKGVVSNDMDKAFYELTGATLP